MLLCIGDILSGADLAAVESLLSDQSFRDGKETAGWSARPVKNNLQLRPGTANYDKLQKLVGSALADNEVFSLAASPKFVSSLLFSRYEPGMYYGDHVDNAVMPGSTPLRADLSFTIFITAPEDYDGGELVIDDPLGTQSFKLAAGSMILYPSSTLHRVEKITRGVRHVAAGWVQSMIRDSGKRQLLFEMETVRRALFDKYGKTAELDTISKNVSNLWRLWAEL